jgi:hypothetical protein
VPIEEVRPSEKSVESKRARAREIEWTVTESREIEANDGIQLLIDM